MYDNMNYIPQGWQCPVCHRVFAPTTPWCYFCGGETTTTTGILTTTAASTESWKEWCPEVPTPVSTRKPRLKFKEKKDED